LDTANFGNPNGYVVTDISDSDLAWSVAIQSNGKIVASLSTSSASTSIAIARYNTDGSLDTANFGNPNGYVTSNFGANGELMN